MGHWCCIPSYSNSPNLQVSWENHSLYNEYFFVTYVNELEVRSQCLSTQCLKILGIDTCMKWWIQNIVLRYHCSTEKIKDWKKRMSPWINTQRRTWIKEQNKFTCSKKGKWDIPEVHGPLPTPTPPEDKDIFIWIFGYPKAPIFVRKTNGILKFSNILKIEDWRFIFWVLKQ